MDSYSLRRAAIHNSAQQNARSRSRPDPMSPSLSPVVTPPLGAGESSTTIGGETESGVAVQQAVVPTLLNNNVNTFPTGFGGLNEYDALPVEWSENEAPTSSPGADFGEGSSQLIDVVPDDVQDTTPSSVPDLEEASSPLQVPDNVPEHGVSFQGIHTRQHAVLATGTSSERPSGIQSTPLESSEINTDSSFNNNSGGSGGAGGATGQAGVTEPGSHSVSHAPAALADSNPPVDHPPIADGVSSDNLHTINKGSILYGFHKVFYHHKVSIGIKAEINSSGPFLSLVTKFEPAAHFYSYPLREGFGRHVEIHGCISSLDVLFEHGTTRCLPYTLCSINLNPILKHGLFGHHIPIIGNGFIKIEDAWSTLFPTTDIRFTVIEQFGFPKGTLFNTSTSLKKMSFFEGFPIANRLGTEVTGGLQFSWPTKSKFVFQPNFSISPLVGYEKIQVQDLLKSFQNQLDEQSTKLNTLEIFLKEINKTNKDEFCQAGEKATETQFHVKKMATLVEDTLALSKTQLDETAKILYNQNYTVNELESLSGKVDVIPTTISTTCGGSQTGNGEEISGLESAQPDSENFDLENGDLSNLPLNKLLKLLSMVVVSDIFMGSLIGVASAFIGATIYHALSMTLKNLNQTSLKNTVVYQTLSVVRLLVSPYFVCCFIIAGINIIYNISTKKNIHSKFFIFQFDTFPNEKIFFSNQNKFIIRCGLASAPWLMKKIAKNLPFVFLFRKTVVIWFKNRTSITLCVAQIVYIVTFIGVISKLHNVYDNWLNSDVSETHQFKNKK